MPFGIRNGLAVFKRLMDHNVKHFSQVYIDDIVIFSSSWEEHCDLQSLVLPSLQKKCQWGQTEVEFLGHVVGHGKVSPANCKIQAVQAFCQPKTEKQVCQF